MTTTSSWLWMLYRLFCLGTTSPPLPSSSNCDFHSKFSLSAVSAMGGSQVDTDRRCEACWIIWVICSDEQTGLSLLKVGLTLSVPTVPHLHLHYLSPDTLNHQFFLLTIKNYSFNFLYCDKYITLVLLQFYLSNSTAIHIIFTLFTFPFSLPYSTFTPVKSVSWWLLQ